MRAARIKSRITWSKKCWIFLPAHKETQTSSSGSSAFMNDSAREEQFARWHAGCIFILARRSLSLSGSDDEEAFAVLSQPGKILILSPIENQLQRLIKMWRVYLIKTQDSNYCLEPFQPNDNFFQCVHLISPCMTAMLGNFLRLYLLRSSRWGRLPWNIDYN